MLKVNSRKKMLWCTIVTKVFRHAPESVSISVVIVLSISNQQKRPTVSFWVNRFKEL